MDRPGNMPHGVSTDHASIQCQPSREVRDWGQIAKSAFEDMRSRVRYDGNPAVERFRVSKVMESVLNIPELPKPLIVSPEQVSVENEPRKRLRSPNRRVEENRLGSREKKSHAIVEESQLGSEPVTACIKQQVEEEVISACTPFSESLVEPFAMDDSEARTSGAVNYDNFSKFDVFVNHSGRGKDISFVSHLEEALQSAGFQPFIDRSSLLADEDSGFNSIVPLLHGAEVHIAVFSPLYAESSYCLNELVAMLNSGKPVIPVLYHVEPVDLRSVKMGPFAEAFKEHKAKGIPGKKVGEWREALGALANMNGFHLTDYEGNEAKLKREIVIEVARLIPSSDPVKLLGLCGAGGVGKTTLARALVLEPRRERLGSALVRHNYLIVELGPPEPMKGTFDIIHSYIADSYALKCIGHVVRDSKMVYVEYTFLDSQRLLISVFKRKISYEEARKKGLESSHTVSIGRIVVNIPSKNKELVIQETGYSYRNGSISGLVAKTHLLMKERHQELMQPRSSGEPEPYVKDGDKVLELLNELYVLLIQPIEEHLRDLTPDHTVVFIPAVDMSHTPFAALVDGENVPLFEKFAVAVAPSVFSVRQCEELYKNKIFVGGELLVGNKDGYPVHGKWPPLAQAQDEVKAVQRFCSTSAVCVTDESVNMKRHVEQRMRTASWLHFSAHGQISQEFPQGSLLLGCDDSSRLTGDEIKQAGPFEARAVVLSACQTASGSTAGILGLADSFLCAEVPCAVLSMCKVSEEFNIDFMKRLYSKFRDGLAVARAMQQVSHDMRKVTKKVVRPGRRVPKWHVYDLATYVCYGYPGVKFVAEKGKDDAPPWCDLLQHDRRSKAGKGSK